MKLHLGCGERYLPGYLNIDFPLSHHSVQTKSVTDKQADLTTLTYPPATIDEVRLHHVLEHFTRPIALALLVSWRSWLKPKGILHLEVPDFNKAAWVVLNPLKSQSQKMVSLRHIFGSQEADWALHCEGWSKQKLNDFLQLLRFKVKKLIQTSWQGTYNLEVIASKDHRHLSKRQARVLAKKWLKQYLIDKSPTENRLLRVWLTQFEKQMATSWAKGSSKTA